MAKSNYISMPVIRRLPRYYRHLTTLKNRGINRVSSKELSENMGLTASQIRQDLNCFGGFGQQGYGYMVDQLRTEIGNIMGIQNSYKAIILGAGNLGHAVTVHLSFEMQGFVLTGIFDNDPQKIGTKLKDHTILDINNIDEFYQKVKPDMACFGAYRRKPSRLWWINCIPWELKIIGISAIMISIQNIQMLSLKQSIWAIVL